MDNGGRSTRQAENQLYVPLTSSGPNPGDITGPLPTPTSIDVESAGFPASTVEPSRSLWDQDSLDRAFRSYDVTLKGEKAYSCSYFQCARAFGSETELSKHAEEHLENQTYHCHSCSARYSHLQSLKAHLKTHDATAIRFPCGWRLHDESFIKKQLQEASTKCSWFQATSRMHNLWQFFSNFVSSENTSKETHTSSKRKAMLSCHVM